MSEDHNRAIVEALWDAFDRFAFSEVGELLHDDFVCEWPQSGERIRGRDNFIAVNQHYPGQWRIKIDQIIVSGDQVVTECSVSYRTEGVRAVSFFTFKDGLISHLREFWPDPFEPQAWRSQWVERE